VRWLNHAPAGRVDTETVIMGVDLFPTICELTGTPLPKNVKFDGEDVGKTFSGKSITRKKPIFWEYGRNETFGYPKEYPGQRSPNVAVRDGKWKLLVNADGSSVELYDLSVDQNETSNLAEKNPKIAKRLMNATLSWRIALP